MNTSTTCDYSAIAGAANSAATAAGYSLGNYTNKFYVMPHNSACGVKSGSHTISAIAKDASGNQSTASITVNR